MRRAAVAGRERPWQVRIGPAWAPLVLRVRGVGLLLSCPPSLIRRLGVSVSTSRFDGNFFFSVLPDSTCVVGVDARSLSGRPGAARNPHPDGRTVVESDQICPPHKVNDLFASQSVELGAMRSAGFPCSVAKGGQLWLEPGAPDDIGCHNGDDAVSGCDERRSSAAEESESMLQN